METFKIFLGSIFFWIFGLSGVYLYTQDWRAVYTTSLLALLEISLSFDNAVVNAKILGDMPPLWQKRFLTWGMLIAVFGMRLIIPIILVYCASSLGFFEVIRVAIYEPSLYSKYLLEAFPFIAAFGGGFLFMVGMHFFLKKNPKEMVWIHFLESNKLILFFQKRKIGTIELALCVSLILWFLTDYKIFLACLIGVMSQGILDFFSDHFNENDSKSGAVVRSGLFSFIYLEVLDSSFSFDGVVGAFALTDNIFIIMIGLGIGAMFVRSLTIYFVKHETLSSVRYLAHGAHYAILVLAFVLFTKIFFHPPEWITGSVGMLLIGLSAWSSRKKIKSL